MKKRFAAHGFELTPNNLRQVRVPRGAEALPNEAESRRILGSHGGHAVYFLPGIPREMERIYLDHVAPRLRAHMARRECLCSCAHLARLRHGRIAHRSPPSQAAENIPRATLHFRTDAPENHVKVVIRGLTRTRTKSCWSKWIVTCANALAPGSTA